MLSPVPGLGDGRGGTLAVPAVVPHVAGVAALARVAEPGDDRGAAGVAVATRIVRAARTTETVVLAAAVVEAPSGAGSDRFRVGTIIDTFA